MARSRGCWCRFAWWPLLCFLASCGGSLATAPAPPGSSGTCDPNAAARLAAVTIQNTAAEELSSLPVAVALDASDFDFAAAASDGSDIGVWDAQSKQPAPYWIESYDPVAAKALLWVKLSALSAQSSATLWLTSGSIPHCTAQAGNGYAVFPFFSDVNDIKNWTTDGLTLSDTVPEGPIMIESRQTIESDGSYNSTPAVAQASNGDWVLSYRKGTGHVLNPLVIVRRSSDQGATWSPEATYWDTSGNDPSLARTPGGDLLIEFVKKDPNGISGAAYSRSSDNGVTWGPFTFLGQPVSDVSALPTLFVNDGATMYAAGYGPATVGTGSSPSLWVSSDDGLTWSERSELREGTDPSMSETSIAELGAGSFLAISRADDGMNTYGRFSEDAGVTWDPLLNYTSQVGVLQLPQLLQAGSALLLFGRENFFSTTQLVAFASYDGGQTFSYGTVLDHYANNPDGGYCWPMLLPDGRLFLVFYTDPTGSRLPDIQSLFLRMASPQQVPANAIHLTSHFALDLASRSLNLADTRYAMDFRFRTHDAPGGNQFIVKLQDDSVQPGVPLVSWRLPSEFTGGGGFIADGALVQLFTSFSFDQSYRVRSIIDESAGQQQNEILDPFGNVITSSALQPFVNGMTGHATHVYIGNNTTERNVDALLQFLFVRPLASADPQVTVSRLH